MEAQALTLHAGIRELGNRHRQPDETIRAEMIHPSVDSLQLRSLKQRKLRLKEEITSLEARTG
ncbi:YdcH family protein [Brevundimonas sp.]